MCSAIVRMGPRVSIRAPLLLLELLHILSMFPFPAIPRNYHPQPPRQQRHRRSGFAPTPDTDSTARSSRLSSFPSHSAPPPPPVRRSCSLLASNKYTKPTIPSSWTSSYSLSIRILSCHRKGSKKIRHVFFSYKSATSSAAKNKFSYSIMKSSFTPPHLNLHHRRRRRRLT